MCSDEFFEISDHTETGETYQINQTKILIFNIDITFNINTQHLHNINMKLTLTLN